MTADAAGGVTADSDVDTTAGAAVDITADAGVEIPADAAVEVAEVIDLSHDGLGIARLGDRRIFVPGALPGERIRVRPRKRRRQYRLGDLIEIVEPSESRVEPPCEYFGRCGGCAVQHLDYAAQVVFKESMVREALARIGGVEPESWLDPITGPEWNYRRRARLGVRYVKGKQRVLVGFKERATRYVTDMGSCRVLVKPFDRLPGPLGAMIGQTSLWRRLPQVELAAGEGAGAVVFRVLDEPSETDLTLFAEFGRQWNLDIYLQRGGPGTVRPLDPERTRRLAYGLAEFDVELEFAPTDFLQINARVNENLVAQVVRLLELDPSDRVLDLYCGLGNFSLPLARRAGYVLGVEGDGGLVARAAANARLNGLDNASFSACDLNETGWRFLREAWDVVVLDPPRSGADSVVNEMAAMGPRRIAYVSCHPATMARDARTLIESRGYRLLAASVADMFPHTHHVEAVALFEKR